jgi:hypothetical protein
MNRLVVGTGVVVICIVIFHVAVIYFGLTDFSDNGG